MDQLPQGLVKILKVIDAISEWSGKLVAWLIIPMVAGVTYEVLARYGFNAPTAWAYDLTYMLYGSLFMLGAAYTLRKGGHIRTDFFYENFSTRTKGIIDASGYLFFFFPGMIFFLIAGWEGAAQSWRIRELSEATAWRPPIYPFKTVIPVSAFLLLLQGIPEFVRSLYAALRGETL
ncbi:MAG: TRAP transporter small permease subunit [Candidatus Rokuibacteriota bacterium]